MNRMIVSKKCCQSMLICMFHLAVMVRDPSGGLYRVLLVTQATIVENLEGSKLLSTDRLYHFGAYVSRMFPCPIGSARPSV